MAIADREKELIGIRTKAALKAKKAKGFTLGKPENMTEKGRKKAWKAVSAKAAKNENNMRAVMLICEYKDKGMTLQAIAEKLNLNGFKTSQGAQFQKVTVKRLHERYCQTTA
jgi:DNA invertase Pin-like site-specific DNA recombinase